MLFGKVSRKSRAIVERVGLAGTVLLAINLICNSAQGSQNVSLGWNPSNDSTVAGYYLYTGPAPGVYTNRVNVGNNTATSISGLQEGQVYHFAVTAYNSTGAESTRSSDFSYITPGAITLLGVTNANAMNMKFPVAPNHWYEVQASADMQTWTTIGQTSVATSNAWNQFSDAQAGQYSTRFYRLILH